MSEDDTQDLDVQDGEEEPTEPVQADVHSPYQQAQMQAAQNWPDSSEPGEPDVPPDPADPPLGGPPTEPPDETTPPA